VVVLEENQKIEDKLTLTDITAVVYSVRSRSQRSQKCHSFICLPITAKQQQICGGGSMEFYGIVNEKGTIELPTKSVI